MPNTNLKEEKTAEQQYAEAMRKKILQLQEDPSYNGFFKMKSPAQAALSQKFAPIFMLYSKKVENEEIQKDLARVTMDLTALAVGMKDDDYLHRLGRTKSFLNTKAPDGRTHFENLVDLAASSGHLTAEELKLSTDALKQDLDIAPSAPQVQTERFANEQMRKKGNETKSALEWIAGFKNTAKMAQESAQFLGKNPNVDWIVNTFAVRSLAEAKHNDKATLAKKSFTAKQICERADQLMADKQFKNYIQSLKDGKGEKYKSAANLLLKGNGGLLEDQFSAYMVATNKYSSSLLGRRYCPTAKQMIELMQQKLRNPESTPDEKQKAMQSIIAVRQSVGAQRAKFSVFGDSKLNERLNVDAFEKAMKKVANDMSKLSDEEKLDLQEAAKKGHGGEMKEKFSTLVEKKDKEATAEQTAEKTELTVESKAKPKVESKAEPQPQAQP